jgi:hypothetical protein
MRIPSPEKNLNKS